MQKQKSATAHKINQLKCNENLARKKVRVDPMIHIHVQETHEKKTNNKNKMQMAN